MSHDMSPSGRWQSTACDPSAPVNTGHATRWEGVMARTTDARPDERREARTAVAEAKRASSEARKLAKTLSRDARAKLEAITAAARADVKAARKDLDDNPRRARRTAKQAAARLNPRRSG